MCSVCGVLNVEGRRRGADGITRTMLRARSILKGFDVCLGKLSDEAANKDLLKFDD